MRLWLTAAAAASLLLPAVASAQVEVPPMSSGGASPGAATTYPLAASAFSVAPGTVRSGTPVTVRVRLEGPRQKVRARIVLRPSAGGRAVGGIKLGTISTGADIVKRWRPMVEPGAYVARLRLAGGASLARGAKTTFPVTVEKAPPPPPPVTSTTTGVFPVRGDYTFGSSGSRFGASRGDHVHQGQDVSAPEGTPLVSPLAGSVYWRAVQPSGAGHYLVIRGDDGKDYVFMHLVADSATVEKGDRVKMGQQIGQVGSTGDSDGAHLHFEIWPDGWYAPGSEPIDPLPTLKAWAAG